MAESYGIAVQDFNKSGLSAFRSILGLTEGYVVSVRLLKGWVFALFFLFPFEMERLKDEIRLKVQYGQRCLLLTTCFVVSRMADRDNIFHRPTTIKCFY